MSLVTESTEYFSNNDIPFSLKSSKLSGGYIIVPFEHLGHSLDCHIRIDKSGKGFEVYVILLPFIPMDICSHKYGKDIIFYLFDENHSKYHSFQVSLSEIRFRSDPFYNNVTSEHIADIRKRIISRSRHIITKIFKILDGQGDKIEDSDEIKRRRSI